MPQLEILGSLRSTFVRTACLAAAEKGVPYVQIDHAPHSEPIAALSPTGKIPVMRHGDVVLFECLGICAYIDLKFDGPPLTPDDPMAAAEMLNWISFINDSLDKCATREIVIPYALAGEDGPDRARIDAGVDRTKPLMAALDAALGATPYLAGPSPTIADLLLYPVTVYIREVPDAPVLFACHPNLTAWFDRMSDRASVADTLPAAA